MDLLPEIVFEDIIFACSNPNCPSYSIRLPLRIPQGAPSVICGACDTDQQL